MNSGLGWAARMSAAVAAVQHEAMLVFIAATAALAASRVLYALKRLVSR